MKEDIINREEKFDKGYARKVGRSNQDRKRRSKRWNIIKREKETKSLKNLKNN